MNPTIKIAIGTMIAFFVLAGIAIVGLNTQKSASDGSTNPNAQPNLNAIKEEDVAGTITYTGKGFEPNTHTIEANSEIRVRNRSQRVLQFVSDPYIEHTDNPELNQGIINPGESKTFYLSQKGRWKYHNALDPSETGRIIVR